MLQHVLALFPPLFSLLKKKNTLDTLLIANVIFLFGLGEGRGGLGCGEGSCMLPQCINCYIKSQNVLCYCSKAGVTYSLSHGTFNIKKQIVIAGAVLKMNTWKEVYWKDLVIRLTFTITSIVKWGGNLFMLQVLCLSSKKEIIQP